MSSDCRLLVFLAILDVTYNLMVQVEYTVTNCPSTKETLISELKSKIIQMNSNWRLGFCKTDQGENDNNCDSVDISVDCTSNLEAVVTIIFPKTP